MAYSEDDRLQHIEILADLFEQYIGRKLKDDDIHDLYVCTRSQMEAYILEMKARLEEKGKYIDKIKENNKLQLDKMLSGMCEDYDITLSEAIKWEMVCGEWSTVEEFLVAFGVDLKYEDQYS